MEGRVKDPFFRQFIYFILFLSLFLLLMACVTGVIVSILYVVFSGIGVPTALNYDGLGICAVTDSFYSDKNEFYVRVKVEIDPKPFFTVQRFDSLNDFPIKTDCYYTKRDSQVVLTPKKYIDNELLEAAKRMDDGRHWCTVFILSSIAVFTFLYVHVSFLPTYFDVKDANDRWKFMRYLKVE